MNFNKHSELRGLGHALFSPSNYHWINYDLDKMRNVYANHLATLRGTRLHNFASQAIDLGINMPSSRKTLNLYINDAIGYRMTSEQPLFYSRNFWGTTDAISFRKKTLRIHDLKTGLTPADMRQLQIYAALFCLEYGLSPDKIQTELRIYQNNDIQVATPHPDDLGGIMNKIVMFDNELQKMAEESGIDEE